MQLSAEIVERFDACLKGARKAGELEPTAMSLSTLDGQGGVSSRLVLLKAFDADGFVFYTNLESIKGRQLAANPAAALVFHWKTTEQQVRVEGRCQLVSDEQADAYFASRDRGSQLGAWASQQSQPMKGRTELLKRVAKVEARHLLGAVPRPPHWSGYRVQAHMVEFWYGRTSRLHDRYRYTCDNDGWQCQRLFP
jgi:pyridoxamine 5'-phosphate oxidase